MDSIDQTIKDIRPGLHQIAPWTFFFSLAFGIFNIILGVLLFNNLIFKSLELIGIIPMSLWGVIFFTHGAFIILSLATNNWNMTRKLHIVGIAIKSAWWLEILAVTVHGFSPFLLLTWSLLIALQAVIYVYFTPRINRD
jgi:hypothetical protein